MDDLKTHIIDFSLVRDQLKIEAGKRCSRVPDSIGDQLTRLHLKMFWASNHNNYDIELMKQALELLTKIAR